MIGPVDWSALPRLRGEDVRAARSLRAQINSRSLRAIRSTLSTLLRLPVAIEEIDAGAFDGVSFDVALRHGRAGLVVEASLAIAIVGALLGDRRSPVFSSSNTIDPAIVGALGAIVEHVTRKHVDVGARAQIAIDGAAPEAASLCFAVRVADTFGRASVAIDRVLSRSIAGRDATIERSLDLDGALANVPLRLYAVVAFGTLDAIDLAAIGVGDALRFDAQSRVLHEKSCVIAPADVDEGVRVDRVDGGAWRWNGARVRLASVASTFDKASAMGAREPSDRSSTNAASEPTIVDTLDLLAALPVAVRAEIGSVTMTAKHWSTMRAGDVVVLDRAIGSPVILRANGAIVARGVAVDVDGVFGVRISEIEGERGER